MLQDWIATVFCQPIYNDLLRLYPDLFSRYAGDIDPDSFTTATWNGPVARSINPRDDEEASKLAIQNGTSSPQKEAANRGYNWLENVEELAAFCGTVLEKLKAAGVEEEIAQGYVATILGMKQVPQPPPEPGEMGSSNASSNAA
jgi:hypothetical protein